MSKVYLKEIRDAAEQHTVNLSRKQLSEAFYYSAFREMPVTLLDTRYRALPEDIWTQILVTSTTNPESMSPNIMITIILDTRLPRSHGQSWTSTVSDCLSIPRTGAAMLRSCFMTHSAPNPRR